MMTSEREGFNLINNNNHGFDVVVDDDDGDDDEYAIDAEDLLRMLDEDVVDGDHDQSSTPEFPTTSFYESTDDTHGSGLAFLGDDQMAAMFPTDYGAGSENSMETVEALEQLPHTSPPDIVLSETDSTLFSKYPPKNNPYQPPNLAQSQCYPFSHDWNNIYDLSSSFPDQNFFTGSNYNLMSTNEEITANMKNELDNPLPQPSVPWSDTNIDFKPQVGGPEISLRDFFDGRGPEFVTNNGNYPLENIEVINSFNNRSDSNSPDETSTEPCHWTLMGKSPMIPIESKLEKKNESYMVNGLKSRSFEMLDGFSLGSDATKLPYPGFISGAPNVFSARELTEFQGLENNLSQVDLFPELGSSSCYNTNGVETQRVIVNSTPLKGSLEVCEGQREIDESNDLCIIEGASGPPQIHPFSGNGKRTILQPAIFNPQSSTSITPFHHAGSSGTKLRASDERLILQSLVQDLSQPKIEASPPEGSLTVPLLRHQRIALSWMVQKETNSLHCSGGILADDQGLGKTVSTIALILSERPTSSKTSKEDKQGQPETLDLDEEDDNKQTENKNISSVVKGRPSAGTLIVCPTSVLRQWAEELGNKVTSTGNLSVYVYHGSNRTKDPFELSKYDVVLTTYSIVSMEVPKQPLVRKGGKEGRKSEPEDDSVQPTKKRKHPSTSEKRRSKKGGGNELVESVSHPLAKVGWFRVVLDEAQSIKNHRTRVAQACWGLRAKRRWCLSGTPIQNAIDDLYSYFRFLKYDPYSVYNSFCSMVKNPIQKNPVRGYQKLQAVLKNIMLRRTKGTLLDGKPIINLPPKSIKLKKVEFSEEERDFYSRLEADSRAQFQAYADSGTVKQNYVNILLMLLRLRQACDHPFLVHGYDCSSVLKSSIHTARKLPHEKQIALLSCLEASLAICGICKDPPEDAVVSICGHVFCNQCISERFTGDDNQCPTKNCKSEINASFVFSKATLKSCLSDHISENTSQIPGFPDQKEVTESRPASKFESSKIKAALEVLNSLSNSNGSKQFTEKSDSEICGVENENNVANNGSGNTKSVVKEKAIVFSQWTRMLDLLEDCLKESSIQYRRLDGTMSVVARDKAVRDFNTLPEVSVMIMSLKAASLGLNMVAACHVVLLDLWWNPTTEDQAIDRAHRIGQTRPVTVVRLTVKDTVEDRILALQQKKRELVASAFGEDEKGSRQSRLTVEDLTYLFMA